MTGLVLILIVIAIALFAWAVSKSSGSGSQVYRPPVGPPLRVPRPTTPPRAETISWVPSNQDITIAGYPIRGGLIYSGHTGRSDSWNSTLEPSMIDPHLPIRRPKPEATPPELGYWPSYAGIQPESRDTYLRWLATGRSAPSIDIG